jgi:Zn-dependent protease with chaperone function/fibronectin type 3 domain-containing protein
MENRLYFPDLENEDFLHPLDEKALNAVQSIKGLDSLINAMNRLSYERILRIHAMGDNVRVTEKTCSSIYEKAKLCAKILNMDVPDIFISQNPFKNAFTIGTSAPMIVLYSGLIDFMDDEELMVVIAHEMGHIKCNHVLYRMIVMFLQLGTKLLGPFKIIADLTISLTLLEWSKKAELSADRAALLVAQDIKPIIRVMMKLAGGTEKIADQIDYDDFLDQSRTYNKMTKNIGGKAYKLFLNMLRSHPFSVMRASLIEEWSRSDAYKYILERGEKFSLKEEDFSWIPLNFKGENNRPAIVPLTWDKAPISIIQSYNLYKSEKAKTEPEFYKNIAGLNSVEFNDTIVENGKTYYYCLSSVDVYNNESEKSKIIKVKTKSAPVLIRGLKIENSDKSVKLKWSNSKNRIKNGKINIYRSSGDDNLILYETIHVGELEFIDKKVKKENEYKYCVRVESLDGLLSKSSNIVGCKIEKEGSEEVVLAGSYKKMSKIVYLKWENPENEKFEIYLKHVLKDEIVGESENDNYCYSKNLKPGKKYSFYVKSEKGERSCVVDLLILE